MDPAPSSRSVFTHKGAPPFRASPDDPHYFPGKAATSDPFAERIVPRKLPTPQPSHLDAETEAEEKAKAQARRRWTPARKKP